MKDGYLNSGEKKTESISTSRLKRINSRDIEPVWHNGNAIIKFGIIAAMIIVSALYIYKAGATEERFTFAKAKQFKK